jgi:excisionase family DNA binding protein
MSEKESRFITIDEVAELFDVKPITVREWCRTGKLKAVRPGRNWKILRKDVYELAQITYGGE